MYHHLSTSTDPKAPKTEMGHPQNMQNQDTHLVLSSDPKPRLKWTPELHRRFADSVSQLGGADKATPKALMRMMGIPGLTLYHLKSHLQKYRLGKSNPSETYHEINQPDYKGNQRRDAEFLSGEVGDQIQSPINESLKIAQTLQMQMEVQRKLHEQIEVQRHLQLRIEAQGKYLQSVLKKAQETLSGCSNSSSPIGVEIAKAELSQLASMVDNGGPSSSVSVLTEEKSGNSGNSNSVVLSLMDLHPNRAEKGAPSNQGSGRKRSGSTISDGNNCGEQKIGKKSGGQSGRFDLNSEYYENELDSGSKAIDLN